MAGSVSTERAVGPLTSNVPGAAYPRLDGDGLLTFRVSAPDADAVRIPAFGDSLGDEPIDLLRGADGYWTGVIDDPAPGFHYYRLEIAGVVTNDPSSQAFGGYGRRGGLEIPDRDSAARSC